MIFSRAAAYAITLALRLDDPPKDKSCEPTFGDFGNTGNFGNSFLIRVNPR